MSPNPGTLSFSPVFTRHEFDVPLWNLFAYFTERRLLRNGTWPFTPFILLLTYETDTASFENIRFPFPFQCRSVDVAWPPSQTFGPVLLLRNKTASLFKSCDSTISLKLQFFLHCMCEAKYLIPQSLIPFFAIQRRLQQNMYYSSCKIRLTNSSSTCATLPPTLPVTWVFPLQKIISMQVSFQDSVWSIFELLQELPPDLRAPTSKTHIVWHLTR